MKRKYKIQIPLTEALLLCGFGLIFAIGIAWAFSKIPTGTDYDTLFEMIGMLLAIILSVFSLLIGAIGLFSYMDKEGKEDALI